MKTYICNCVLIMQQLFRQKSLIYSEGWEVWKKVREGRVSFLKVRIRIHPHHLAAHLVRSLPLQCYWCHISPDWMCVWMCVHVLMYVKVRWVVSDVLKYLTTPSENLSQSLTLLQIVTFSLSLPEAVSCLPIHLSQSKQQPAWIDKNIWMWILYTGDFGDLHWYD